MNDSQSHTNSFSFYLSTLGRGSMGHWNHRNHWSHMNNWIHLDTEVFKPTVGPTLSDKERLLIQSEPATLTEEQFG